MNEENKQAAIKEIAYIYHLRNLLGRERDRLRHKLKYLRDIKNSKQVKENFEHSSMFKAYRHSTIDLKQLAVNREEYLKRNPVPKTFKDVTLSALNIKILEAERKVVDIKIRVMKHTKKYDKRLKELSKIISPHPKYVCGIVTSLSFKKESVVDQFDDPYIRISMDDMKKYHDEFLANKAIDNMLKD